MLAAEAVSRWTDEMNVEQIDEIKLEAEVLACQVVVGLVAPIDVVEWADGWIARIDEPPYALIEVASAGRLNPLDVASRLRDLSAKPRDAATLRCVLKEFGARLRRTPNEAKLIAQALYQMALSEEWANAGIGRQTYSFDDELDLAASGIYGDLNEVTTRLQRFLDGGDE